MIRTEEEMYSALLDLSMGLHELEGKGVELPERIDKAWEQITEWLEAH